MKRLIAFALVAMALSGCGLFGSKEDAAPAPIVHQTVTDPREAAATSLAACAVAIKDIATGTAGTEASRIVAVGSIERLCGGGGGGGGLMAAMLQRDPPPQQQPSVWGQAWNAVLGVADVALRVYGIKSVRDVGVTQSNNQRDVAISTNSAFVGMGNSIMTGSTAGYPYVQAPGSTTNNTLSGTGVLGSGTYTAPVTTTTRNCNGGQGANGGAGGSGATSGSGAAGGSGAGGTC